MSIRITPAVSRCLPCNYNALKIFASFAGLTIRPVVAHRTPITYNNLPNARGYMHSKTFRSNDSLRAEAATDISHLQPAPDTTNSEKAPEENVPWYLREAPQREISVVSERQKLPELPSDSPQNLQAFLEHLSIDIGLDNLAVIDLRQLDPPAALGSNLIMLLGTARSEKHLHVSADRFCRWLRTKYKLSPYADGLLGRNELKLKLRRKARRAKLLGSRPRDTEEDDGIRTNWVCVNVGAIEETKGTERSLESEGIEGFGGQEDGVNLVVQMFTEDKRETLDLESLWTGFIRRQDRKITREMEQDVEESKGSVQAVGAFPQNGGILLTQNSLQRSAMGNHSPRQGFHTYSHTRGSLERTMIHNKLTPNRQQSEAKDQELGERLAYLESLPRDEALEVLGKDFEDYNSTPFLRSFFDLIPPFPRLQHWIARFKLVQLALVNDHPGFSPLDMERLLLEMQTSIIDIPVQILEVVALALVNVDISTEHTAQTSSRIERILAIFEDAGLRNLDIVTMPICESLITMIDNLRHSTQEKNEWFIDGAASRLTKIMGRKRMIFEHPEHHAVVLDELSLGNDWNQYWEYWRRIAIHKQRRPQLLYALMFTHVAESGVQRECAKYLNCWTPEMEVEDPPINITGALAVAMMKCLKVADPDVQREVELGENPYGNWVNLWKHCQQGLDLPSEILEN